MKRLIQTESLIFVILCVFCPQMVSSRKTCTNEVGHLVFFLITPDVRGWTGGGGDTGIRGGGGGRG